MQLHEIDFFGSQQGLDLIKELGLSPAEVLEVQLMSIATVASSSIATAIAHMDPPDELVEFAVEQSPGAQIIKMLFGEEQINSGGKKAVHAVLHTLCSLSDLVEQMMKHSIIVQERAQANYQKLATAVETHAAARGNVH